MMSIRRRLLEVGAPVPSGLGEFTKAFTATLQPTSATAWVVQHNLGIVPKVVLIDAVGQVANYYVRAFVYYPTIVDTQTWYATGMYWLNANNTASRIVTEDIPTETEMLMPIIHSTRGKYDTNATYYVRAYA